ncbi:diphosphomevalonate decarboxylase [Lacinutrix sp. MedPE-SW]|uniref:diphosphomevalonate/mevalonate 3,5-bisphosphate decarboxylase family protein n=1 Tax=Lacinutrix sp. MedPE-SW TaxID=1860087 RepID=UPI00091F5C2F|nr:diphosphomevalonate decarboxylase [Lacinutrix sp. MedPE-SW]OIQ23191.1 MAG: diphosphomevalonate decarboxylase [Lacinutrix sp. MedPE-SW]
MIVEKFIPLTFENTVENGEIEWASPSNIALVKYWGKKENQIPENQSISFTLNECKTITKLSYILKDNKTDDFDFQVYLDGERKLDFEPKIKTFFNRIYNYVPFLKNYKFKIETKNTFPHSSGIASSASGMSALALCLMSIEKQLNPKISKSFFNKKASFLARLGSGSASRSIEGDLVVWGKHNDIEGSSDLYGIKYPYKVHENFKNFQDTILLVDKGEKQVSSTVGHNLMYGHPYAKQRFDQANSNISVIKNILESGDLEAFIALVESEALTLHAMMMTSMPYFILMKPNTLEIINKIWGFRKETKLNICFTLDAGANVHILYPENEKEQILEFIKTQLVAYCQNGHYICDSVGLGAKKM